MRGGAGKKKRALRAMLAGAVLGLSHICMGQTTASWLLPVSGTWTDATKWSTNPVIPNGPSVDAIISAAGSQYVVTYNSPTALSIRNLTLNSTDVRFDYLSDNSTGIRGVLAIEAGTFNLRAGGIVGATITASANGHFVVPTPASTRLDGVVLGATLEMAGRVTINSGLTMDGGRIHIKNSPSVSPNLFFNGATQELSGTGEIIFDSDSANGFIDGSVSIAPGITIRTGQSGGKLGSTAFTTYQNSGRISAQTLGKVFSIEGTFLNSGTLEALNGSTLRLSRLSGAAGTLLLDGGTLSLNGTYTVNQETNIPTGSSLALNGAWTNAATINLAGGTLLLGGSFTHAQLSQVQRSSGVSHLIGTLQNANGTLHLNSQTGDWYMGTNTVDPEIRGGIVSTADGVQLRVIDGTINRFRDVTLAGTMTVQGSAVMIGSCGLTDGHIHLDDGVLISEQTKMLGGSGTILFDGIGLSVVYRTGGTLTLESGITVKTGQASGLIQSEFAIRNEGTVLADTLGKTVTLLAGSTFTNSGTILAMNGGSVLLSGAWVNSGTMIADGGSVAMGGTFTKADIGALTRRNGGAITLAGTLSNSGQVLDLDQFGGVWQVNRGSIVGGEVTGSGTSRLVVGGAGTFDGVRFNTSVDVPAGGNLTLRGDFVNDGVINVNGGSVALRGTVNSAAFGSIIVSGGSIALSGGTINNAGGTLDIAAQGGPLFINGGTIIGGRIISSDEAPLRANPGTTRLIGTTLSGPVYIRDPFSFIVINGLTLDNGMLRFPVVSGFKTVEFPGSQTLGGNGTVLLENTASISAVGGTLTLAPGIVVQSTSSGDFIGTVGNTIINEGRITRSAAGFVVLQGTFTNAGLVEARDGGRVSLPNPSFGGSAAGSTLSNYSSGSLVGGSWAVFSNSTMSMGSSTITTNNANVLLDGSGSSFVSVDSLHTNLGTFVIDHGRNFVTTGSLSNSGLLGIGTNSTMFVSGQLNNTGSIDLVGTLIVDYAPGEGESSTFDTLVGQIGTSILTSVLDPAKSIGSADNAELLYTSFGGQAVDSTSVLLMLTYFGDTNLDGVVGMGDFDDFVTGLAPADAAPTWTHGDFNYSGTVTLDDFELYLNGYYALGGSSAAITNAVQNAPIPDDQKQAMLVLVNTVPEPVLGLTAVGLGLLVARRRCRRG